MFNLCVTATRDKSAHEFEYRMLAADGRVVWLRDIVSVVVEDDRPISMVCYVLLNEADGERTIAELLDADAGGASRLASLLALADLQDRGWIQFAG